MADNECPVWKEGWQCVNTRKGRNVTEEERRACEDGEQDADDLEGQMQIEDFPEVMP